MKRWFVVSLFFLILLSSCNFSTRVKMKRMAGEYFTVPSGLYKIHNDTIFECESATISKPTIVVWIDSLSCMECTLLHFDHYHKLFSYCKDSIDNAVDVMMIFSPKHNAVETTIRNISTYVKEYDVYVDYANSLYTGNPYIADDENMHSFLLDRNGRIQLIGYPLYTDAMWNLYRNYLCNL